MFRLRSSLQQLIKKANSAANTRKETISARRSRQFAGISCRSIIAKECEEITRIIAFHILKCDLTGREREREMGCAVCWTEKRAITDEMIIEP
jgi:hypothetical protein